VGVLSRTIRLKVEVQYWCARAYSFIADSADKARRKVAESLALLAQILLQHGKASLAAKAASRAISLEGRNPKWHVLFAKAQEKLGNILEAIEAVERAIALDESHPEWHASLASLLRKADRLGEAVAAANRAIAIDSTKLECRMLLSQLNEDLEKHPLGRLEKAFARALTASSALSWEVGESVCSGSDGSFRTGHYGVCAPLELVQNRGSGFRALLSMLPIDRGGTVLDIGAGGVGGWQTTDHLVEFFVGRIIGFQPDENRCAKLRAKYAGRVEMINSFYGYGPKKSRRQPVGARGLGAPFDLIVLDTRPQDLLWEKLLPFAAKDGLRPGGYAICTV
jgi:hypothetical protein